MEANAQVHAPSVLPSQKNPGTQWIEVCVVPQSRTGLLMDGKNFLPSPGFRLRSVLVTMSTTLPLFLHNEFSQIIFLPCKTTQLTAYYGIIILLKSNAFRSLRTIYNVNFSACQFFSNEVVHKTDICLKSSTFIYTTVQFHEKWNMKSMCSSVHKTLTHDH